MASSSRLAWYEAHLLHFALDLPNALFLITILVHDCQDSVRRSRSGPSQSVNCGSAKLAELVGSAQRWTFSANQSE